MRKVILLASLAVAIATPASAQVSSQEAQASVALPMAANINSAGTHTLAAGTIVAVSPLTEISSKHVEVGQAYKFTVVNDVVENGVAVIPRGSIATGVIKWKTGRAIGGKSGKFEVTFQSVQANGRDFPLMGTHRQEGRGNTVGALLGSILISGRSAVMLPGQIVNAMIAQPTSY
jgi:hypothetical protein